jgi:DNA-binding CsgD family transcriptional regulator
MRLSGSDYRGILEFVHTAGEVEGSDPFPEHVLARLRELVPCDTVSYGDFDPHFDRHGHVWRTDVRYSGELRARDFSERDKLVLETLQPHLVQLWRNAAARRRESRSLAALTPREREVLLWVARGKSNREIAAILYLAPSTIRKHLENVYDKLGVSNRAGAVGRAFSLETETFAEESADSMPAT